MRLHVLVKLRLATDLLLMFVDHTVLPSASFSTKPLSEVSFKLALTLTGFSGFAIHTSLGASDFEIFPST